MLRREFIGGCVLAILSVLCGYAYEISSVFRPAPPLSETQVVFGKVISSRLNKRHQTEGFIHSSELNLKSIPSGVYRFTTKHTVEGPFFTVTDSAGRTVCKGFVRGG